MVLITLRLYVFKSMLIVVFAEYTSLIDYTLKMSCHQSSNFTYQCKRNRSCNYCYNAFRFILNFFFTVQPTSTNFFNNSTNQSINEFYISAPRYLKY